MNSITAYIRLANEENTILPCLESIRNIFDQILVIYSEITDRSLELIYNYIKQNNIQNITIKKYPYHVLPPHSKQYISKEFNIENSLAAYYNFGLQFINTDLLMKIDADQIYFNNLLSQFIDTSIKTIRHDTVIGCRGYNCIIKNENLFLHAKQKLNGGNDHFIIYTDNAFFTNTDCWEILTPIKNTKFYSNDDTYWIHMKDGHWYNSIFVHSNNYPDNSLINLEPDIISKYETYVLPLLINNNSIYQYLKY